jgi:uncharacterized OB-fold protein
VSPDVDRGLTLGKCATCHARFVPCDGPCPRCASPATELYRAGALGAVLAATSLDAPPPGWPGPHPLALVEVEDGVRLLVVPDAPLPAVGSRVEVRADGAIYRCRPAEGREGERGEGDVPKAGSVRPSFEPPR